jgi:hypothetical protein
MPRTPNPVAAQVLEGELIFLEPASQWTTGKLGPVSQKLRTKGYRLRTKVMDGGIYAWGEWTGVIETWSSMKKGTPEYRKRRHGS